MTDELIQEGRLNQKATAQALRRFLEQAIKDSRFELKVAVRPAALASDGAQGGAEVIAEIDGRDKEILLERGGEVLKALEHLAFRALRLEPEWHDKIHIDCGGYRALRLEELRMTARVAAERVQTSRQPFRLNPMSSQERRIVHLALRDMPGVRTESVGMGDRRQVVIHPADNQAKR